MKGREFQRDKISAFPLVVLITLNFGLVVSLVMSILTFSANDLGHVAGWLVADVLMFMVTSAGWALAISEVYPKKVERDHEFCSNCGKETIQFRQQDGFDSKTGEPFYQTRWACPDVTDESLRYDRWRCNNVTTTVWAKANDQPCHTPPSMSCNACLNRLVEQGTFTKEEAALLRPGAKPTVS